MQKDKFSLIKNSPPFKKRDIIIYLFTALIIASLFIAFVVFPKTGKNDGFRVITGQTEILSKRFGEDFFIANGWEDRIEITGESEIFTVKIYTDEKKEKYNILEVTESEKTVDVTDSNCSFRKDCVHTSSIKNGTGVIICVPHGLKILPLGDGYYPPVTG